MRRIASLAIALSAALVLSACSPGGDDEPDPTTTDKPATTTTTAPTKPADAKAAKAEITTNFQTFFADGTALDQRVALLEDGEALRETLEAAEATSPPGVSVAVKKITFTGAESADVTFDVVVNGSPALAD